MKLLVLAQTPPPLHGQSVMVRELVGGLPSRGVPLHHIDFRLSRNVAEIGRWHPRKVYRTAVCALRALAARFRHGCDTLYYVPAPPGKRGALYRDWVVMALCRPVFCRLVLHWHAVGLAEWLQTRATAFERTLTRALLGRADLAIVLAERLRGDAEWLAAKRVAVVPNGIHDPGTLPPPPAAAPFRLLFMAICSEEKGLLAAGEAVIAANRHLQAPEESPAFTLTAAGSFDGDDAASRFAELAAKHPRWLQHVGFVGPDEKRRLFTNSHALCLPTRYAAEGQPLVVLEALAHDRPVVATQWRALPEIVTEEVGILVPPGAHPALVAALVHLRHHPPPPGACRRRYEEIYTLDRHLSQLAAALANGG
jgi:glycosyltransferase involved in cell wall biosynthesis